MRKFKIVSCFISFLAVLTVISLSHGVDFKPAKAQEEQTVVKVGWYETPIDWVDQFGRKNGYNYEYQCKVASYTDWTYEYVEGSWPELFQKLQNGEIDLLSDVSYVESRKEHMFFSSLPMGTEDYYLFVSANREDYVHGDYTFFNGKKIAANKGSVQIQYFNEWADKNDINAELIEITTTEQETINNLENGTYDAYLGIDSYASYGGVIPVVKVGSSEYYFAVNKARPDLHEELDQAMSKIHDENPFYSQYLHDKYYKSNGANLFLGNDEKDWLTAHGKVKVGYLNNYLAYCGKDKKTGELTGALKVFLELSSDVLANAHIDFEAVGYDTSLAATNALQNNEIDCIFPVNFGYYEAEQRGLSITQPFVSAGVDALVRKADQNSFSTRESITVAVDKDDLNYISFVKVLFPEWTPVEFSGVEECLKAVSNKKADCFLISTYRYNNIARLVDKYSLISLQTNKQTEYSFAVSKHSNELYSIICKLTNLVPETSVNAALTYFYAEETANMNLGDYIRQNPLVLVVIIVVFVTLIIVIVAQRRMIIVRKKLDKAEATANIDALTGVKNHRAYILSERRILSLVKEDPNYRYAIVVCDINDLKYVNDKYGHNHGDEFLKEACHMICNVYAGVPIYRIGGDEFVAILEGEKYKDRETFLSRLKELSSINAEEEDGIVIAAGMAERKRNENFNDVFKRADKQMYLHKDMLKKKRPDHNSR